MNGNTACRYVKRIRSRLLRSPRDIDSVNVSTFSIGREKVTLDPRLSIKGRGSLAEPANRFERIHVEPDWEQVESDRRNGDDSLGAIPKTEYFLDQSESLVTSNSSPDIPFQYSVNPYRGCSHGCAYCYARPSHEYLGLNAGIDFETKVFVKQRAPELFRDWLASSRWQCEPIMFSGVTDCYQPIERKLRLTQQCLEVASAANQPVMIITKNALITRDVEILGQMAERNLVSVAISITTLDAELAGALEPRTSRPDARLRAVQELSAAGIPVHVMVAPVIPGLTDIEIPAILAAAKEASAIRANYILLRLPMAVAGVFQEWMQRVRPSEAERIESRIRQTRGGELYQSDFGHRMRGQGPIAEQIQQTFNVFRTKYGLDSELPKLDTTQFRPPTSSAGQQWLF